MNRREGFDIAVVGAGMVGGAVALALAQRGFRTALIEERVPRAWQVEEELDFRVVALAASSVALLEDVGVWRAIAQTRACPYRRMQVWDALSSGALEFNAEENGSATLGYIVENRLIQHVLWQALQAHSEITVYCPARLMTVESSVDARLLRFEDGTQVRTKLLLAADGAASKIRSMMNIATHGHDYAQTAIVAHVASERPHQHTAWQRFLPGGPLAFLPLSDGRSSLVWTLPTQQAERIVALNDAAFCRELGAAFDFHLGLITATTARVVFPLKLMLAERYISERCVLLGDAAHTVHPLAGQGVNLGFRDVTTLLDVLQTAQVAGRDYSSLSTLRKYERKSKSNNALAAWGFDGINRLFSSDSASLVTLRSWGLHTIQKLTPIKKLLANQAAGRN